MVAVLLGIYNFANQMGQAILVLLATQTLHVSTRGYGLLLAASAVGSVVGGLVNPVLSRRLGLLPSLVLPALIDAAAFVGIGLAPNPVVVAALLAVQGFSVTMWNVVTVSLRQRIVPGHLLGRVNSVYRMLGWGLMPLGALAGGFVAHAAGLRAPYVFAGLLCAPVRPAPPSRSCWPPSAPRPSAPRRPRRRTPSNPRRSRAGPRSRQPRSGSRTRSAPCDLGPCRDLDAKDRVLYRTNRGSPSPIPASSRGWMAPARVALAVRAISDYSSRIYGYGPAPGGPVAMPDFLVIGAPKAGTTALHAALAEHPGLYLSAIKEPKFFLTDGPPPAKGGPGDALTYREHVWRRPDYEALFEPGSARHAARRVDSALPVRPGRDAPDPGPDPGGRSDRDRP